MDKKKDLNKGIGIKPQEISAKTSISQPLNAFGGSSVGSTSTLKTAPEQQSLKEDAQLDVYQNALSNESVADSSPTVDSSSTSSSGNRSRFVGKEREGISTDDYENMRSESWRALLNSEIQANIAKQNALKYTQNQLNQTGYANQGMAQSTALGIENSYRNALADANNQYRKEMIDIQEKENAYNEKLYEANDSELVNALYDILNDNNEIKDENLFKQTMENWDAKFDDNNNMDLSDAPLPESSKRTYEQIWEAYKGELEDTGSTDSNEPKPLVEVPKTSNNSNGYLTNKDGSKITVEEKVTALNGNLKITVDGKTFDGIEQSDRGYGISLGDNIRTEDNTKFTTAYLNNLAKDFENGSVFLVKGIDTSTKKPVYMVCFKNKNGVVRRIEKRGNESQQVVELAKLLGAATGDTVVTGDRKKNWATIG